MAEYLLLRDINVRSELFPFRTKDGIPTDTLFNSISYIPLADELLLKIVRYSAKKLPNKWGIVYSKQTAAENSFHWINALGYASIFGMIPEEIGGIVIVEGSSSELKKYSNIYGENQTLLEINTGDRTIKSPLVPRTEFGEILSNTIKKANRVNHIMKVAMEEHIPLRKIVEPSDNPKWNRSDWNNYPKLSGEPLLRNAMVDLPNSTLGTFSTMVFRMRIAQMIHSLTGIPPILASVYTEEIIEAVLGITYTFPKINNWRKRTNMDTTNGSFDHLVPLTNLLNRTSLCDTLELTRLLGTDGHRLWEALDIWMRTAICSQEGRTKLSMFRKGTWINRGAKQMNHPIDALLQAIQDVNDTTGAIEASKTYLYDNIDPQDILPSPTTEDAEQLLLMFTHRSIVEEEINNARRILDGTQPGGHWANAPLRNTLGIY